MSELSLIKNTPTISQSNIPNRSAPKDNKKEATEKIIPFKLPITTEILTRLFEVINDIFFSRAPSYADITSVIFSLALNRISDDDWNVVVYSLLSSGYPDRQMCVNIRETLKEHVHLPKKIRDTIPTIDHWFDPHSGNLKVHFQNLCECLKSFWIDDVFGSNTANFQKGWTAVHALFEMKMYGPVIWFFQQMTQINSKKAHDVFTRIKEISINDVQLISIPCQNKKQFAMKVTDAPNQEIVQQACDVLLDVCKQLHEKKIIQPICAQFDVEFKCSCNYTFTEVYDRAYHLVVWYKREDLVKILYEQMFDISPQHAKDIFGFAVRAGIID